MNRTTVKAILAGTADNRTATVYGWIRTKRESKNVVFLELNDGSCLKNLQIVIDKNSQLIDENLIDRILTGASIKVVGPLSPCQGGRQSIEMQAESMALIGESPANYPLQKKRHSFDFLRGIPHLRPRTNTFGAVTRVRNTLSKGVHDFFQERGFLWIHTPIITGSDAEGAGHMFQVTSLDLDALPRNNIGGIDYSQDFFGKKSHLTVSGQLQVENFACSMCNVYTFGPTFRAENSNTTRHLSEFWMVEPEIAFCDLDDNRALAEDFIQYLLSIVLKNCAEDMAFFNQWIAGGVIEGLERVTSTPFAHLTYTDAIKELENATEDFEFKPIWGAELQSEHERYLTEKVINGPVIVTDYPKGIKAFYMKQNDDGKTVRAMDVLVPRLGEIIGGSQREDNPGQLEERMREIGMDLEEYQWYIDLRRYGSVPHSGFGLGFERLVQYVTGMQNIRDIIPFPRAPKTMIL